MTMTAKTDLSIAVQKAGWYSMAIVLPMAILLGGGYVLRWGFVALLGGIAALSGNVLILVAAFLFGIFAHEGIHGLAWILFGRKPLSAIRFGFQLKTLTPYAHCIEPMEVNAYRLGTLMPGLLLGILPSLVAIVTGTGWLIAFGLLFTVAAGGDFLILWLLRGVQPGSLVEDHPSRAGCYVLENPA